MASNPWEEALNKPPMHTQGALVERSDDLYNHNTPSIPAKQKRKRIQNPSLSHADQVKVEAIYWIQRKALLSWVNKRAVIQASGSKPACWHPGVPRRSAAIPTASQTAMPTARHLVERGTKAKMACRSSRLNRPHMHHLCNCMLGRNTRGGFNNGTRAGCRTAAAM